MSVISVQTAIKEFLASSKAEVLCIRGHWGTGKTYAWKTTAKSQRSESGAVAFNGYAYVSLFGVNSITDLKSQILQNTVTRAQMGDVPSMETATKFASSVETATKKGILGLVSGILGTRSEAIVSALGLLISKQIVCIDDLERKGEKLSTGDVLGYLSHLKEERGCKVVILLNDEALNGSDKQQFAVYLEKVVDRNLLFAPTAEESIAASMVVMGWVHHQPSSAPSIEFLKGFSRRMWGREKQTLTLDEEAYDATLSNFGFSHLDDLDIELYHGIANGYFTQPTIDDHASEFHRKVLKEQALERHREAYNEYHNSFRNGLEVVTKIADSFIREVEFLSVENLQATVSLLRELSLTESIKPTIDAFIASRKDNPAATDNDRTYTDDRKLDPEIVERLKEVREEQQPKKIIEDILSESQDVYEQKVVIALLAFPIDEYERMLRTYEGKKLAVILRSLGAYSRIGNPTDDMKEVTRRYHDAMRKVATDSDLNRHRVLQRGIKLRQPEN